MDGKARVSTASSPGEPYIRAAALYGLADLVRSRGGDAAEIALRVGIDPEALADPDLLVSFPRHGLLMEAVAAELDIPDLGLELALGIPPHFPNAGPVIFLARLADTLGGWIERMLGYWHHHTNGYFLQLMDDAEGGTATMRMQLDRPAAAPRQQCELQLASCCRMARVVTGQAEISAILTRFRHERPRSTRLHEQFFRSELEFGAAHDEIVFDRRHLVQPTSGGLGPPKAIFDSFVRYRIRQMSRYNQSVRTTTEIAIRAMLGSGMCSKEFIAESMGTTPGRLRRLLANNGTTFAGLLDETRRAMACRMLARSDAPVSAIAGLLDYSSATALALAMKRWTGMTPSQYRGRAGPTEAPS